MTVFNYRLPLSVEKKIQTRLTGGPAFETRVFRSASGLEERSAERNQALGEWDLSLALLTPTEFAEVEALFFNVRGMWGTWLFRNPADYKSANTVTISGNPHKPYTITGIGGETYTYHRPLNRTIPGTISGSYREFFTPVRFTMDRWPFRYDTLNVGGLDSIGLVEVILDDFA